MAGLNCLEFCVQGGGFSWLFPFQNGAPPIGWHDAICYLVLPVALVVSQFATQKILQPPAQDESAQSSNAILKFLPLMIGEVSAAAATSQCVYCVCACCTLLNMCIVARQQTEATKKLKNLLL